MLASIVALAVLDRRSRSGGVIQRRSGHVFNRLAAVLARRPVDVAAPTSASSARCCSGIVIGAISSDDGYNLTIARVSGDAGYTANYYRFFGTTEAPFDWYQSVLAHMAAISTAGVWMRLPATAAAIGTWLIISRCVLPRLGRRVANNRVAVWTAGAVFLAAWLPFNNGLRPEPLIAFGTIAAWMLVENTHRHPPVMARRQSRSSLRSSASRSRRRA